MKKILKKYYLFRIKKLLRRLDQLESPEGIIKQSRKQNRVVTEGFDFACSVREAKAKVREKLALYNYKVKINT